MSSMVSRIRARRLGAALLISCSFAHSALAQTVSVPVVQPLPKSYPGAGNGGAPVTPSPSAPSASLAIPTVGEGSEWDQARERLRATGGTQMAYAIDRWKNLVATDSYGFSDYSSFVLAYPGFPNEDKLRRAAEKALERSSPGAASVVAFFDRNPPLTNPARAQYALALSALGRPAQAAALAAWRGGPMSDAAEAAIGAMLAGRLTPADQNARMDALLWAGASAQAQRQLALTSPDKRALFASRLAAIMGTDDLAEGAAPPPGATNDAGWVYNRARMLRSKGSAYAAAGLLANRSALAAPALDAEKWIDLQLDAAGGADALTAMRIALKADEGFAPGTDVSRLSFTIRDQYTTLTWQGGLKALWQLGDPRSAAALFWRYGAAARTPQTRSKGFYWAGKAMAQAGDAQTARTYFEAAAKYSDQFYGLLALERLGRPVPPPRNTAFAAPSGGERANFAAAPLTAAVREVARESDWPTAIRFFREIADQAQTPGQHQLVADLARELGRRDLGVILGQAAEAEGLDFGAISFPLIPVPEGANWTWVHAISRQESQFAMNAVSHAGARGLMQLMPGTARGEAGKVGLSYDASALMNNAGYNLTLGDSYFRRMLSYFSGSYPLAVAAYNAGPGNVNKWLRANGDPRGGGVDWVEWIERIPLTETRNYVQRVMENAVVYEAMNPAKARYKGPNPLSYYLGKRSPG